MTDCHIIGFNDYDFDTTVRLVEVRGQQAGSPSDLPFTYFTHEGRSLRLFDALNEFDTRRSGPSFANCDVLSAAIMHLGTALQRRGFSFGFTNLFQRGKEELRRTLGNDPPVCVAITTTFYVTPHPVAEIIGLVRDCAPDVPIVVGGPLVYNRRRTASPTAFHDLLTFLGADVYVISSEGERSLCDVVGALSSRASLDSVNNLAYRLPGGGYRLTATVPEDNPLPGAVDFSLFEPGQIGPVVPIRTAKSCPFSCAFCDFPQVGGKYRYMDLQEVADLLDALTARAEPSHVMFIDDTFNVPKGRFSTILDHLIERQHGFKWSCFLRSDHTDPATIYRMAEAGCVGVFLGIESGSDAVLKEMNKTARAKNYRDALPHLRQAGIKTFASFIVGFPGETEATVGETIDFIEEIGPDFFMAQTWFCQPGTPVAREHERHGLVGTGYHWSHRSMDSTRAGELVERIFLSVTGSIWLPVDFWSLFYLESRGVGLPEVTALSRAFNDINRARLLGQSGDDAVARLKSAVRQRAAAAETNPLLSGSVYKPAERALLDSLCRLPRARPSTESPVGNKASGEVVLPSRLLDGYCHTHRVSRTAVLAGLTFDALRQAGREPRSIALRLSDGSGPLPLVFDQLPSTDFVSLVQACEAELHRLYPHRRFANWVMRHTGFLSADKKLHDCFDALLLIDDAERAASSGADAVEPVSGRATAWASQLGGGQLVTIRLQGVRQPPSASEFTRLLTAGAGPSSPNTADSPDVTRAGRRHRARREASALFDKARC